MTPSNLKIHKFFRWTLIFLLVAAFTPAFILFFKAPALAAETTIDATIHATVATHNGSSPTVVFTSDQVGYAFYRDSGGACSYSKTANGGTSWGIPVTVDTQTDCLKVAVWYDQWTPGDTSGTNIHIVTMDAGDLWYAKLDTSSDSLTTTVNATGANQGGGFAVANIPSITKSTTGIVYMGVQDATDSFVIKCGSSCDNATNWTEAGTNPFDLAVDYLILMPLSGGNIIVIRRDSSADTFGSKVYNASANSWDAAWTAIATTVTVNATYDASFGATVNRTTGDIYLAYAADTVTLGTNDDIRTAVYSSGVWTAKTDVLTNDTKGITGAKIALDENNGNVYVVYSARTTSGTASTGNVYYKKSTDGMTNWGLEIQVNTTAGDLYGARVNILSNERIYTTWDIAATDDLMGNTVADISPPDTTTPAAVSSLSAPSSTVSSVSLTWTAPGDDGSSGTATTYDVRYSTSNITSGNFASATAATGEPSPSIAGSTENFTVTGLSANTIYYFALKTSDEVPNTSAISNVVSKATPAVPDTTAPADTTNLVASSVTASAATLTWTAPGDDGSSGTATTYDVRYSTSLIDSGNFGSATAATGEPPPSIAGSTETFTVTGLSSNTTYFFALKTSDEVPNTSGISNVVSTTTLTVSANAVKFVIIDPSDSTTDTPVTVTVQAQKNDNSTDTNYQNDVTLVASGSATGGGLVSITNGQGIKQINDSVAETVTLSLSDTQSTGLIVSSTQQVVFSSPGFPAPSIIPGPAGGGAGTPTSVKFSGRAYPGAKLTFVARELYAEKPFAQDVLVSSADGSFSKDFVGILGGPQLWGIIIADKDGRTTRTRYYNLSDQFALIEGQNLFVPPTIGFTRSVVTKGDFINIIGYATPGSGVEIEVDGKIFEDKPLADKNGYYKRAVATANLSFGRYSARARQIDKSGHQSDFSLKASFSVSNLLVPKTDLNNDGIINVKDWSIFLFNWTSKDTTKRNTVDFNGDGKVDVTDFSVFLKNF